MKRLKELRETKGFTQQELAEKLHVTQQSIYKYEHDLSWPDSEILIQMAEIFDTTVDYLIGASNVSIRYEIRPANSITSSEQRLLAYYRKLSPRAKELIQELIQ